MQPKVTPILVLSFALLCATILAGLGKIPVTTIDQILLLIVGGALGALGPTPPGGAGGVTSTTLSLSRNLPASTPPQPPPGK